MPERTDSHALIIAFWCDTYQEHVGAKYPFNGGKDGATIKWLRGIYSDEDIRTYITAFFEMDDEFIQQSGYALGVFRGCLPKVISHATHQRPFTMTMDERTRAMDMRRAWGRCQHHDVCESYSACLVKIVRSWRGKVEAAS